MKKIRLQSLRGDFGAIKMKDSKTILKYCSKVKVVVNERFGDKIEDVRVAMKILHSVTPKFDYAMCYNHKILTQWSSKKSKVSCPYKLGSF